jgi:antitoxin component YwqK of YwqJK toxin-antitoxin module
MKKLILIILVAGGLVSCMHTLTVISENQLTDDVFYLPDAVKPYTGKCLINYGGTHLPKVKLTFKNGILQGPVVCYYENSKIKRKGEYLNGLFHGKWESWDEKGNKILEANYENDSLNGAFTSWYPGGKILEKGKYSRNRKTGDWTMYNQDGSLLKEMKYQIN